MRYIQPITILVLLILLIFGWLHYSNKESKTSVANLKEKLDSAIKPHHESIIKLRAHEKVIMGKIKKDSVVLEFRIAQFRKENAALRKQLKEVRYTGNPSTVPDDSVIIAMQAAKEAPIKDAIIERQDREIDSLNDHIERIEVDYNALTGNLNEQIDQQKKITEDHEKYEQGLEKEAKKSRRKGIWNGIKIGAVALCVGVVIGLAN